MKAIKKTLVTTALAAVMVVGMSTPAHAADTVVDWEVNYSPGAPTSVSKQTDVVRIAYSSNGYYANCKTISGDNGRLLTITSPDAGGMDEILITTTGKTKSWKMKGSSKTDIALWVTAKSGYLCKSTGTIYTNK